MDREVIQRASEENCKQVKEGTPGNAPRAPFLLSLCKFPYEGPFFLPLPHFFPPNGSPSYPHLSPFYPHHSLSYPTPHTHCPVTSQFPRPQAGREPPTHTNFTCSLPHLHSYLYAHTPRILFTHTLAGAHALTHKHTPSQVLTRAYIFSHTFTCPLTHIPSTYILTHSVLLILPFIYSHATIFTHTYATTPALKHLHSSLLHLHTYMHMLLLIFTLHLFTHLQTYTFTSHTPCHTLTHSFSHTLAPTHPSHPHMHSCTCRLTFNLSLALKLRMRTCLGEAPVQSVGVGVFGIWYLLRKEVFSGYGFNVIP